jgi:hypothetical protein
VQSEKFVEMLLRAIALTLGTLVIRSAPVLVIALVMGFWTGWFDTHPEVLAGLIGWSGLLLVEIWIEYRHWKAKRNARKTP